MKDLMFRPVLYVIAFINLNIKSPIIINLVVLVCPADLDLFNSFFFYLDDLEEHTVEFYLRPFIIPGNPPHLADNESA